MVGVIFMSTYVDLHVRSAYRLAVATFVDAFPSSKDCLADDDIGLMAAGDSSVLVDFAALLLHDVEVVMNALLRGLKLFA